jgi:choline dehydrogenase
VRGDTTVDRVLVERGRAVGVCAMGADGAAFEARAGLVVLTAGAYGTPAILLRSGIGPARELERLGIDVVLDLPGVGANLHDHPMAELDFSGTPELTAALADAASRGFVPEEQTLAKLRSSRCREAFDLHLAPVAAVSPLSLLAGRVLLAVACMAPLTRGRLSLAGRDPEQMPVIDHGYLSDPEGADLEVIVDGVRIARELARTEPLASLIGHETGALAGLEDDALRVAIRGTHGHYYHPVGTARMGREDDPLSVCDSSGRVLGSGGLWVGDCALIPTIPRANTNIPAVVVGARVAKFLQT